jgi:phenol/toluene 2-monooxygenase (NADH) P2/A2
MSTAKNNVFLALQTNEETRPIIEAIQMDNPHAVVNRHPAMVKIDSPGRLVLKRETVEGITGVDFDLQSIHVNLISLAGNLDETEDELILEWKQ